MNDLIVDEIEVRVTGRMPFVGVVHQRPVTIPITEQDDPRLIALLLWLNEERIRQANANPGPADLGIG